MLLTGANILLAVCGGIAAYKSCELARMFVREGANVHVVLTPRAAEFVTPLTFTALTNNPARVEEFPRPGAETRGDVFAHLNLTRDIDCMVVCPATATTLGKFAHGIADNLVSACYLSNTAPVVVAPAMNTRMWQNPAVQHNLSLLEQRGVVIVPPVSGELACGDNGDGKLAGLEQVFTATAESFTPGQRGATAGSDLAGRKIVVTAGGTREYLDPVRFITNASTGTLALEVASGLLDRGAEVVLVDTGISVEPQLEGRLSARVTALTAFDMLTALSSQMADADGLVMLAAVADYSPSRYTNTKRKKDGQPWKVEFSETTDVLATIAAQRRDGQALLGVSLEDTDWVERGMNKAANKHVDALLAVELGGDLPFGDNRINCALVDHKQEINAAARRSKAEAAGLIVDYLAQKFADGA